jgi:hypothetical protein
MKHPLPAKTLQVVLVGLFVAVMTSMASGNEAVPAAEKSTNAAPATRELTLDACLDEAMLNSHRRPASQFAVAMAEAQHRQALAGYWPQINGNAGYQRMDEAPDFLFPASKIPIPATPYTPASSMEIPAQDVKLMDPDNFTTSVNATWLLYDGGMRKGLREQTGELVEMMKQEARRTDLEIADSVKRLYYGAVLARQLASNRFGHAGPHGSHLESHRNHVQGRQRQSEEDRLAGQQGDGGNPPRHGCPAGKKRCDGPGRSGQHDGAALEFEHQAGRPGNPLHAVHGPPRRNGGQRLSVQSGLGQGGSRHSRRRRRRAHRQERLLSQTGRDGRAAQMVERLRRRHRHGTQQGRAGRWGWAWRSRFSAAFSPRTKWRKPAPAWPKSRKNNSS